MLAWTRNHGMNLVLPQIKLIEFSRLMGVSYMATLPVRDQTVLCLSGLLHARTCAARYPQGPPGPDPVQTGSPGAALVSRQHPGEAVGRGRRRVACPYLEATFGHVAAFATMLTRRRGDRPDSWRPPSTLTTYATCTASLTGYAVTTTASETDSPCPMARASPRARSTASK